ncbi:unnamed protein product [Moneuplotes crassus]|uniref:Fumarylacetoacetase-like C-terminal domain-containing protein n=1 Tax=Euplotes crassus TaxID=5936 RepID=A0AAD2D1B5_EUPCR|nr:unnamed protein product [Moneuplotes crassus]
MLSASVFNKIISKTHNKVIGVAKNYVPQTSDIVYNRIKNPYFFFKPNSSILDATESNPKPIKIDSEGDVIPEIELGFMISKTGKHIKEDEWQSYVGGYFLAMDITDAKVLQKEPMNLAFCKGQDSFTPIGKLLLPKDVEDPHDLTLKLEVNGSPRIEGKTGEMIYSVSKMIRMLSIYMTLEQGDMILTGSPISAGRVKPGDQVKAQMFAEDDLLDEFSLNVEVL